MNDPLVLFVGSACARLGEAVCRALQVRAGIYDCQRFADGEMQIELRQSVRGRDVFLLQSTSPPVDRHLLELLLLADACHRAGAARLTAVVPYFGYARQDKRSGRRSLGGHVVAQMLSTVGLTRLLLVDVHTPSIEGFFDVPIDILTAVPLLAQAAAPTLGASPVVVAPDLGAVKLAREYARLLRLPMAVVHKTRLDGARVAAHDVIGDVRTRTPLIVDDMLSTGATIEAAVGALRAAGALEPMSVAVTHALLVGGARELLMRVPLSRLVATDTVPLESAVPGLEIVSVAPVVATAIRRDHDDESLADLRASG